MRSVAHFAWMAEKTRPFENFLVRHMSLKQKVTSARQYKALKTFFHDLEGYD